MLKPKAIVLIDNSKSMSNSKISLASLSERSSEIKKNYEEKGYETELLAFDKNPMPFDSLNGKGNQTDIFSSTQAILERSMDDNLKKITLVTDGNYNLGNNPIFIQNNHFVEINTILVGDTTPISDIKIENVEHNPIILSNETSQVNINISSLKLNGGVSNIKLVDISNQSSKIISTKSLHIPSHIYSENIQFQISNPTKGKHHYRVEATTNNLEINTKNNAKDFYIDVVDGVKTIEILSNFPHPDISALKSILEKNKSFHVSAKVADIHTQTNLNADLFILYQIPNNFQMNKELIERIKQAEKSVLFILGSQSNYNAFNQFQQAYKINLKGNMAQDYLPIIQPNFSKFYLQENTKQFISKLPPLSNNLLTIQPLKESANLLNIKMGGIATEQPLIAFSNDGNQMIGMISSENIWKWKLMNYTMNKSFVEVQDIFEKIVNYLAIKKDKKQLVTNVSSNSILESEKLIIYANTFNALYQPAKASQIKCILKNKNGVTSQYEMIAQENSYSLEPSGLKEGDYSYTIEAIINGKKYTDIGSFSITKEDIESQYLPSDFENMKSFSEKNGGQIYLWNNFSSLFAKENKAELTNKIIKETNKMKANDILILLIILLSLLSIEWLLRKYFGLH